jgi:hypothetical protein
MMIGNFQVKIEAENRGEHGIYGKVYERNVYEMDAKWKHILTLAPGMKLSKDMFYSALRMAD